MEITLFELPLLLGAAAALSTPLTIEGSEGLIAAAEYTRRATGICVSKFTVLCSATG